MRWNTYGFPRPPKFCFAHYWSLSWQKIYFSDPRHLPKQFSNSKDKFVVIAKRFSIPVPRWPRGFNTLSHLQVNPHHLGHSLRDPEEQLQVKAWTCTFRFLTWTGLMGEEVWISGEDNGEKANLSLRKYMPKCTQLCYQEGGALSKRSALQCTELWPG